MAGKTLYRLYRSLTNANRNKRQRIGLVLEWFSVEKEDIMWIVYVVVGVVGVVFGVLSVVSLQAEA